MIITLVCGGSGSENIQRGLYKICPNVQLNLLINGYDDGKSTGVLRKLFPNTLGISDFRKNQVLEYCLLNGKNKIYCLLNHRFTNDNPYHYLYNKIYELDDVDFIDFFIFHLNYFFNLEQSKHIVYEDFSFMNIIYCSLLDQNEYSMTKTCEIIKNKLGLKNNIYLNSEKCLILKGITENNSILENEATIVNFDSSGDKITDVFFDIEEPILLTETKKIIETSDIIILSCGTQFSSLIPTYKTQGFNDAFKNSKASKYLILNAEYDNDIIGYTGNLLLEKINKYIAIDDLSCKIIISNEMNVNLFPTSEKYNYMNISNLIKNKNHDGYVLWKYLLLDYFNSYNNKNYIFDYDYTIYDPKNPELSKANIRLIEQTHNCCIVTNNCMSNLLPISNVITYSNMSNIKKVNNVFEIINDKYTLSNFDVKNIINIIEKIINLSNYDTQNRKNMSLSIKPVVDRETILNVLNEKFVDTDYVAIKTGKTTIEIIKKGLCKRELFISQNFLNENFTYVSDMNDISYNSDDKLKLLQVADILTTNLFLNSIVLHQKYDFCIVVGGINKRMNINYPKCLYKVDNITILEKILLKIHSYANNIYICGNNYYRSEFGAYENAIKTKYNNVVFHYFDSIDGKQNFPKGNGETIYQFVKKCTQITNKIFILWGDTVIENTKIFEEMYNYYNQYDILIPVIYESDPYAYLNLDKNKKVVSVLYKKNQPVEFGYHDQCVFLCDTFKMTCLLEQLIKSNDENEYNFLDIVKMSKNVDFFETSHKIYSFNNIVELNAIAFV